MHLDLNHLFGVWCNGTAPTRVCSSLTLSKIRWLWNGDWMWMENQIFPSVIVFRCIRVGNENVNRFQNCSSGSCLVCCLLNPTKAVPSRLAASLVFPMAEVLNQSCNSAHRQGRRIWTGRPGTSVSQICFFNSDVLASQGYYANSSVAFSRLIDSNEWNTESWGRTRKAECQSAATPRTIRCNLIRVPVGWLAGCQLIPSQVRLCL